MPIYELINPSDPYTFEAPNIEVAGAAVVLLSTNFGAVRVGDDVDERTPMLFGWDDWLAERGIDTDWVDDRAEEIADALDSFLIGSLSARQDVLDMLDELPEENRQSWRDRRQDRHRSSMNQIGEAAYQTAMSLRAELEQRQGAVK